MVEPIPDLPPGVIGFSARGRVTREDYETVIVPAVEAALAPGGKLRLLYHLGPAFEGFEGTALLDDAKVGLSHPKVWDRVAVVTDTGWLRTAVKVLGFTFPGELRIFEESELGVARDWLSE